MRTEDRRNFFKTSAAALISFALAACKGRAIPSDSNQLLDLGEDITRTVHRSVFPRKAMAREFAESQISADFRANGSTDPTTPEYLDYAGSGFENWSLTIGGLVERPLSLDMATLRSMPKRSQITRHDCVEGWSAIAKWSGVTLGLLLEKAGLKKEARYIIFYCADDLENSADGSGRYYESIDLEDAFHPQSILAYDMNDMPLPIEHGAPIRLRVERQLGYKHAKYVMRIEAVSSFEKIGAGRGGYWPDRGYDWYAGV